MAPRPAAGPKKFAELCCLSKETIDILNFLGFHTTTPVQEATIPLFCGHKDVAVDACTGSGKTLAFVLPVIERLRLLEEPLKAHQVGAIIISPTRELAKQIYGVAEPFMTSVPGLTSMLLVGGTDPAQDVAAFKSHGAHVLVGTPGRIEDVLKRCSAVDLRRLEVLVLDEADRLLDMGFKAQLDAVMARLPKQRRTGLFSATQTEAVQELARAGLRNPVRINVAVSAAPPQPRAQQQGAQQQPAEEEAAGANAGKGEAAAAAAAAAAGTEEEESVEEGGGAMQKTPNSLSIQYVVCEADEKIPQLVRFLALHGHRLKLIVYALTCAAVDHLAAVLPRLPGTRGVRLRALHGKMKQAARERELEAFRGLPAGALLCTDLAARGLDIPDVHWIVQLDPPQDPAAFVHRVGRTARMGRAGSALVLLMPHEEPYVEFLRLRKVPLTEASQLPPTTVAVAASGAAANNSNGNNQRPVGTSGAGAADNDEKASDDAECGPGTCGRAGPSDGAVPAAVDGVGGGSKKKKKKKMERKGGASGDRGPADGGTAVGGGGCAEPGAPRPAGKATSTPSCNPTSTSTLDVLAALRAAAERDRDVMEKATKAFVTYVRGYKEHHCKFIFRLQDLNIGRLAAGLGLLRLPRMPDLKKPLGMEHFIPSPVDPATVPYRDKSREKQRLKALQQRQEAAGGAGAKGGAAAANGPKRKAPAAAAASDPEARLPAAKRRQLQQIDEAVNLNKEYSLLKKLKKGKISEHQYDVATGLSSDSDLDVDLDEQAGCGGGCAAGRAAAGRCESGAAADSSGSGADSGDDDGVGGEKGAGAGVAGAPGSGSGSGLGVKGRKGRRGQQPGRPGAAVKQPRGALQSYIDKKTKKKRKKRGKQQQQQRVGS